MQSPGAARSLVVMMRFDIGRASREQEAIEGIEQIRLSQAIRQDRDQQRQPPRRAHDRVSVFLPHHMEGVRTDHATVSWDAYDGARGHGTPNKADKIYANQY